jgi:hypothetical protein
LAWRVILPGTVTSCNAQPQRYSPIYSSLLRLFEDHERRRRHLMGIRAVQTSAVTSAIDRPLNDNHPESRDYRAAAPSRDLCAGLGNLPAAIAPRYALAMGGADTGLRGVKSRTELAGCLDAEAAVPLPSEFRAQIVGLGLLSLADV